jgi:hypothetical protein
MDGMCAMGSDVARDRAEYGERASWRPPSSLGSPLIAAKVFVVTDAAAAGGGRTESTAACAPRRQGEGVEAAVARHDSLTVDLVEANAVLGRLRQRRRSDADGCDRDKGKSGHASHCLSPGWKHLKASCPLASAHEIGPQRLAFHHGCVRRKTREFKEFRRNPFIEILFAASGNRSENQRQG